MEGCKCITNDPYILSFVAKGYRLHFTSPPLLLKTQWEIRSCQSTGNVRANIPDASEECRILFKCFPGMQSVRRVTSSNRLKATELSHFHTSLLYVGLHYKLSEYCKKRRLRVQNRSAGCILSCTNPSRQQEVPTF